MRTGHSCWMIASGAWMPFGMLKISSDNQNPSWQEGYESSFKSNGCFSHSHEWTLADLGMMPNNGPQKNKIDTNAILKF
ncbi:hypothetical protein [Carboxylicivirga marina]|uniref:Glycosyl hydrolase family 92 N-terminal domain-containing protein n=1 Tax=Carboxylicivirga marina TaxID=2800988 RepID=A0ABS1HRG2_9BACT|nr:hypothetical protein [Carboxylicivirga marina]MBK3519838.1 hypothetical protein [Carboxylicivirga marina]